MKLFQLFLLLTMVSCSEKNQPLINQTQEKQKVENVLNDWHNAAATANFDAYFTKMDSISVFIGTDATENWTKTAFQDFSKPYFDRGKAWSFSAVQRNVYLNKQGDFAWFDELLDTWMGACRGSGVLVKKDDTWKIKHYVLSVTVPNDDVQQLIDIKREKDSVYLRSLKPTP